MRDRATFRLALTHILAWPFERVVTALGAVCETGGREALRRGYAWIRDGAYAKPPPTRLP